MKLKQREIIVIAAGVAIVLGAWLMKPGAARAAGAASGSLAALLATIDNYGKIEEGVRRAAETLHVTLPRVEPADQEVHIREALARLSQSSKMKMGALKRLDNSSRRTKAQAAVDFQFDLTGQYDDLVKFVHAMESDTVPFQIAELRIESGGGEEGGRRGGNKQADGKVRSSIKVRSYIFPRVIPEKKAEEEKPKETARRPRRAATEDEPEATPTPKPSEDRPAGATEEKKEEATPTPTPQAEMPQTQPTGRKRFVMRVQGQEFQISVEGRTVTMNGQSREMSDEEYAKWQDGSWRDELPAEMELEEFDE
jgi:hypothetical protein